MRSFKLLIFILLWVLISTTVYAKESIKIFNNEEYMETMNEVFRVDEKVYLPLREIGESIGYKVTWDSIEQQIILSSPFNEVKIKLDGPVVYINDTAVTGSLPVTIMNNQAYIETMLFSQISSYHAFYDIEHGIVYIQHDNYTNIENKNYDFVDVIDSDQDGLSDFQEIHKYFTDPKDPDSDDDGLIDSEWNERREYTYTIIERIKLVEPWDLSYMNDDYQDVRVLDEVEGSILLEAVLYPYNTVNEGVMQREDWQIANKELDVYLEPGITTNWDKKMQKDLIRELRSENIHIDQLSDAEVVKQVSEWNMDVTEELSNGWPLNFFVYYPNGVPKVYPELRNYFDINKKRFNENWDDEEAFDHVLLGKGMYYNKTRGTCTASSTYQATIFRALGIPTRIIITIPILDGNDSYQREMISNNIKNAKLKKDLLDAVPQSGFADHFYNEVYVGNRWVRLNYDRVAANTYDIDYFGLMFHINTVKDIEGLDIPETWGRRAMGLAEDNLSSHNPYQMVNIRDENGIHSKINLTRDNTTLYKKTLHIRDINWATNNENYIPDTYYPTFVIHEEEVIKIQVDAIEEYKPSENEIVIKIDQNDWIEGGDYNQLLEFYKNEGKIQFKLLSDDDVLYTDRVKGLFVEESHQGTNFGFILQMDPNEINKMDTSKVYDAMCYPYSDEYRFIMDQPLSLKGKNMKVTSEESEETYEIEYAIIGEMGPANAFQGYYNIYDIAHGMGEIYVGWEGIREDSIEELETLDVIYLYTFTGGVERTKILFPEIDTVEPGQIIVKEDNDRRLILMAAETETDLIKMIGHLPKQIDEITSKTVIID